VNAQVTVTSAVKPARKTNS